MNTSHDPRDLHAGHGFGGREMSERLTSINLPGGAGYADYGRKTIAEMIALARRHATLAKQEAEEILAAKDSDFHICTYQGVHVQRNRIVLQEGRKRK